MKLNELNEQDFTTLLNEVVGERARRVLLNSPKHNYMKTFDVGVYMDYQVKLIRKPIHKSSSFFIGMGRVL